MRLNPPTIFIFLLSFVLMMLSVTSKLGLDAMPILMPLQDYWFAVSAYCILMLGVIVRGL